ncbi:Pectinesterase [Handroanthus impetiginosus]|uniref:pectinesterase n=1 Tax=Handroanthus impetiginosus TaxID=429701 RepID=A0A2G9G703_9LAMI|nr:Pectinesterase [Handroanthus impetiginosus]
MDTKNDTFKRSTFNGLDQQEGEKTCKSSADNLESININDFEEEEYWRKTRKLLIIIVISSIILVLLIICAIIGILVPMQTKSNSFSVLNKDRDLPKTICNSTLYKDSCYSRIYSLKMSSSKNIGSNLESPKEIFMLSLQVTLNELMKLESSISQENDENDPITKNTLDACDHLIQDAIDNVNMSISSLQHDKLSTYDVSDIQTWLSTAITDQQMCLDGLMEFENVSLSLQEEMKTSMQNATEFTSNSLAIISNLFSIIQGPVYRKMLQVEENHFNLIGWKHRRLLEAEKVNLRPNLTVAKDSSGNYRTISEAVNVVPKRSNQRFFIYVKEGEYEEHMTIVSGSLNYADGVATYDSGTFIGRGFIARDIGFKNKAGLTKLQAVALRSSSDKSIFYRCYIDGYQDTLYTHTNRQYYRECIVTGTVDFILGNAAAVFQNCDLQPRQPGPGHKTSFKIQECSISTLGNFSACPFLGRPWNNYSTTIVMKMDIQGIIDPAGWITWEPDTIAPDTIFFAEYKNTGSGSALDQRVTWPGYRRSITEEEAEMFSVEHFIQGSQWINEENVKFDLRM